MTDEETASMQPPAEDEPAITPPGAETSPAGEPAVQPPAEAPPTQPPAEARATQAATSSPGKPSSGKASPTKPSPGRLSPGKQTGKPVPGRPARSAAATPVPPGATGEANASPARAAARERKAREIERRRAAAAAAAKAKRRKQWLATLAAATVVVLIVVVVVVTHKSPPVVSPNVNTAAISTAGMVTPTVGPAGPEVAPLAPGAILAPSGASGNTVDGIKCETNEQVVYHIHAHLAIFVDGAPRSVPYGIGILNPVLSQTTPFVTGGTCFYWLHTHAADGIIHIESPTKAVYSLGDFFDIWGIPLSANQVGPEKGPVTAFYNGKRFTGTDPRTLPLTPHAEIQLDVGKPLVAPETINFGQL